MKIIFTMLCCLAGWSLYGQALRSEPDTAAELFEVWRASEQGSGRRTEVRVMPGKGRRIGAICVDGSTSKATGRGACSGHGGVAYWLYEDSTGRQPVRVEPTARAGDSLTGRSAGPLADAARTVGDEAVVQEHWARPFFEFGSVVAVCLMLGYIARLFFRR